MFHGLYRRPRLTVVARVIDQTSVLPPDPSCLLNFSAKLYYGDFSTVSTLSVRFSFLLLRFLLCYFLFLFLLPCGRFLPLTLLCVIYFFSRASAASFSAAVAFPTSLAGPEQAPMRSLSLLHSLGSLLAIGYFALPSGSLQLWDL